MPLLQRAMAGFSTLRGHPDVDQRTRDALGILTPPIDHASDEELAYWLVDAGLSEDLVNHLYVEGYSLWDAVGQVMQGHSIADIERSTGYGRQAMAEVEAVEDEEVERPQPRAHSKRLKRAQAARRGGRAAPDGRYYLFQLLGARIAPEGWWDEFILDYGLFFSARGLWLLNGHFTASAIGGLFTEANALLGYLLGCLVHVVLSRAEYMLLTGTGRDRGAFIGIVASLIDVVTTLQGMLYVANSYFPWAVSGLPVRLISWYDELQTAVLSSGPAPDWLGMAALWSCLSILIALSSERLYRHTRREYFQTMSQRI